MALAHPAADELHADAIRRLRPEDLDGPLQRHLDVCEPCDWFLAQVAADQPETPEERQALDALERDPAETLEVARRRLRR